MCIRDSIKSIKHTLCNKVLGDLKEYTTIPVSGNPLEMEFILKTVVDNKDTGGIKIVVEDIEGLKEEKIINIEGLEDVYKRQPLRARLQAGHSHPPACGCARRLHGVPPLRS